MATKVDEDHTVLSYHILTLLFGYIFIHVLIVSLEVSCRCLMLRLEPSGQQILTSYFNILDRKFNQGDIAIPQVQLCMAHI
jgi:hypothetical protein